MLVDDRCAHVIDLGSAAKSVDDKCMQVVGIGHGDMQQIVFFAGDAENSRALTNPPFRGSEELRRRNLEAATSKQRICPGRGRRNARVSKPAPRMTNWSMVARWRSTVASTNVTRAEASNCGGTSPSNGYRKALGT